MLKKIILGMLATTAMALNAPAALADDPVYECAFRSVQEENTTGQNYEGVVFGYVVHGGSVSIRCYVAVNGSEVSSSSTGTGTGVAATSSRVTFAAGDTDDVKLCYEVTTSDGPITGCVGTTHVAIPPQVVRDLISAVAGAAQPVICGTFQTIQGTYGPVVIDSNGSVFINGVQWYWCP